MEEARSRRTHLLCTQPPGTQRTLCGFVLQGVHWRLTPTVQTTTCPAHVTCQRCQRILTHAGPGGAATHWPPGGDAR